MLDFFVLLRLLLLLLCIKSISSLNKLYVYVCLHQSSSLALFRNSKKLSKSRAFLFTHEEKVLIETLLDSENIFNDLCRTKKWPIKIIILGDWQRRHHFNAKLCVPPRSPFTLPAITLYGTPSVFLLFLF